MLRYIINSNKRSSTFLISCFLILLLLSSIPAAISSLTTTQYIAEESIYKYGRGSYDILVRSAGGKTDFEKHEKLVEENYLTGGNGGISLAQYEEIKKIANVEVAAPVAVLGYFTNSSGAISLDIPKDRDHSKITTLKLTMATGLPESYSKPTTTHVVTLPIEHGIFANHSLSLKESPTSYNVSMLLPLFYNFIVGVDAEQERKLLGVDTKTLPLLNESLTMTTGKSGSKIPSLDLLVNEDSLSALQAKIEIRAPKRTTEELIEKLTSTGGSTYEDLLQDEFAQQPIKEQTLILDNSYKPFSKVTLGIDEYGKLIPSDPSIFGHLVTSSYFLTGRYSYEVSKNSGSDFTLVPHSDEKKTSYREVNQVGSLFQEEGGKLLFEPNVVGTYKGSDIANRKLDPSPLGLYSFSPVTWVSDMNGNAASGELKPNFTPDTFLPIPASALTNLAAAELLKGEYPIDAIRVRVAGITGYDKEAEVKILDVAKKIETLTGLETDIVAGASKKDVTVEVPAVSDYPAVGVVQEVWTTLGVSKSITEALSMLSLSITGILLIIVLTYAVVHTRTLFILRNQEIKLLRAIGWSTQEIAKMMIWEWVVKLGFAFAMSLVTLLILDLTLEINIDWLLTLSIQAAIILLLIATVWRETSKKQRQNIALSKEDEWRRNKGKSTSIFAIAQGNFFAQIGYNMWNLLLITVSGGLALFTLNLILAEKQQIGTTYLGAIVNAAGGTSLLMVVFATLSVLAFGIWETSRALVAKRRREITILQKIGWNSKNITYLIMCEIVTLFSVGALLMLLSGLGLFRIFYETYPLTISLQILTMLGFILLLLLASTAKVYQQINKPVR
ncbi:FtsX-like permease family protein [Tumebacillus lipolyticus]|uniref:FtsX-like permease family protein n=1 Tax=Tumebacillus lipolyticus TaxID=1280370 RepID=A0ABW5A2A4_9BACL